MFNVNRLVGTLAGPPLQLLVTEAVRRPYPQDCCAGKAEYRKLFVIIYRIFYICRIRKARPDDFSQLFTCYFYPHDILFYIHSVGH